MPSHAAVANAFYARSVPTLRRDLHWLLRGGRDPTNAQPFLAGEMLFSRAYSF
jgi:hypothetical protein